MSDSATTSTFVGTYLAPDAAYIKEFISYLQRSCIEPVSKKGKALAEAHNAMALYTMQMLLFATGHRSVSDPFFDLCTFDKNNSTVLIEDKVVSSAHHARIAWLPPMAIVQLERYLSHLRSLSRFIRQENSILANQIWVVTEPGYPHPLPLFFFISKKDSELDWIRVQPSAIKAMLGERWILPLNTNRHVLSTWLHRNGCPPEVIDAQLGHIEAGCSPFSSRSALDPEGVGHIVIPYLEAYLKEQGWETVKGLNAPSRLPVHRPPIKSKDLKSSALFGPQVRSANKEAMWRKDAVAVAQLINEAFPANTPSTISDSDIDALQDKIVEESPEGRLLIRLSLFRRYLIKLKRAGSIIKVPGRLALVNKEEACFDINSLRAASRIEDIKKQFLSYLSPKSDEVADQERRIAEILISSSIFGALTSPKFLDALALGFRDYTYRIDDQVIVDVSSSPNSPVRRWMPDDVSWTLILGHCRNLDKTPPPPSADKVNQYLDEILRTINAPQPKKKFTNLPVSKLLAPLLDLAKPYWRFRLPGVIHGYAEGDISCASAPLSNWLRLLTNKPGTLHSASSTSPTTTSYDDMVPIRKLKPEGADYKQAKDCWGAITKTLGKSDDKGNGKQSGDAEGRSNARKSSIVKKLSTLLSDESISIPPIAGLIAAWLIHLCRNGTSHLPVLRANTVAAYGRSIGGRLVALAYEEDFLSLSDISIEEIYRDALGTTTVDNRGYVAARLKEFHSFLISVYAMPEVDWSEIIDDDLLEAEAVDAGIVTKDEYRRALEILSGGADCIDRDRLRNVAVLFFAYRFGLRSGEISRLTVSDVIIDDREMVVYVRNSIYGETKSDNGVRQLPLIGRLIDAEHKLISRWLEHVETYADGDPLATLLPKLASHRAIVGHSACVRAVVEALRMATGDTETRLRHLRHTCASRLFLAMLLDEVPNGHLGSIYKALWDDVSPQFVRTVLIGDSRVSRRALYAMAMFMGHGSPDVTHRHYVHLADIVLKEWISKYSVGISDKALAYAYQTTYANIRKIRSRIGKDAPPPALSEHFTRQSTIPIQKLPDHVHRGSALSIPQQPAPSPLTPADIDRLLSIATMRDSIDGLADRLLTSDQIVVTALLSASHLQEMTGFTDFSIPQVKPGDYWVTNTMPRYKSLEKESSRVRRFLDGLGQPTQRADQLSMASQVWVETYHPHSKSLLVNARSELDQLLDALKLLGIPKSDFEVLIPDTKNEDERRIWFSIEKELSSQGLSVSRKERLPVSSSKYLYDNRVGLILRASRSHQLGYQRTLNRALFITSVWLKLLDDHRKQREFRGN